MTVAGFLTAQFSLNHAGHDISLNPAYKHLGSALGLAIYLGYLTLIRAILWVPAGVIISIALRGWHPTTFGRVALIAVSVFATGGIVAGLLFPVCCGSQTPPFVP